MTEIASLSQHFKIADDNHWCTPKYDNRSSSSSWWTNQATTFNCGWCGSMHHVIPRAQIGQSTWEVSNMPILRSLAHPLITLLSKLIREGNSALHGKICSRQTARKNRLTYKQKCLPKDEKDHWSRSYEPYENLKLCESSTTTKNAEWRLSDSWYAQNLFETSRQR